MNQILNFGFINDNSLSSNKYKKTIFKYKFLLFSSISFLMIFIFYYLFLYFKAVKISKLSNQILNTYDIQRLYSSNYLESKPSIVLENGESAEILGFISISSINLRYPILSNISEDFLRIAPCKFYGQNLNDIGNFCIAGHNYDNGEFFSNLRLLNIDDYIEIYNLDGSFISYKIYDIFETNKYDISCTSQDTSSKEITLITCNNINGNRLIIKAKNR